MNKKNIIYIILGIISASIMYIAVKYVFLFLFTLLFNYNSKYSKIHKTAELNAKEYIENKYHIKAEVLDNHTEIQCAPFCNTTAMSTLKMKYGKKIFYVNINNDKRTIDGYDNYQFDLIRKKIINLLNKETNLKPYKYTIRYGKYIRSDNNINGMINLYYDKTNIEELINEYHIRINSNYIGNADFNKINLNNICNIYGNNATIHLINYKTIKDYEKVIGSEKNRLENIIVGYENFVNFAPYIEKVFVIDGKTIMKNDYSKIFKIDDMNILLLTYPKDTLYAGLSSLKIDVNKTNYKWETFVSYLVDYYDMFAKNLIIDNYLINIEDNMEVDKNNRIYLFVKKDKIEKLKNKYKKLDFLINNGFEDSRNGIYYSHSLYEEYYVFEVNIEKVADKKIIISLLNT